VLASRLLENPVAMPQYTDPERHYSVEYPTRWLPLTDEGSPQISLASLTTGGYLRLESFQFEQLAHTVMTAEATLQALLESDKRHGPPLAAPAIVTNVRNGRWTAYVAYRRAETTQGATQADYGYTRAWVMNQGRVQVRCVYRCRRNDAGVDDDDLDAILDSLTIHQSPHLDAGRFCQYYFGLLKHRRPQLAVPPPAGLTLTLPDGQTILLEHLYNQYRQQPHQLDELIEGHINLLDYCGDDVPDLNALNRIRPLLFPKLYRATTPLPLHRLPLWPGLVIGAVVQGSVFHYGVNTERLRVWGLRSLQDLAPDLLANLGKVPSPTPRGLRDEHGRLQAVSYAGHPFSASFVLYEDFYATTAENLGARTFLVGLPEPGCLSCFRDNDPRFIVEHTARLRLQYHRGAESLTDVIYHVRGPLRTDVRPYDVLHCCVKKN
jgi:hypothetical protein